ncbi:hypothetical protein P5673_002160 [Acropora cervicornis]|uniref:Uncharacterized protein n=1 Tax=Acropora cervicornis TaxID=6130 RepID=A0AAD9R4V1_ACRCE|nr:hypothetical protein P5673_002160 [Acropora cervicornis]
MNSSFFCFFRKNFTKLILACQQIQFQSSKPGIVFSANTVAVEESEKKRSDRNGVAPDSTQGCISQKLDKIPAQGYFRGLLAKTQREPFTESRAKCSGPKILVCNVSTDLLIYFKDQDVFQRFHDLKCLCL